MALNYVVSPNSLLIDVDPKSPSYGKLTREGFLILQNVTTFSNSLVLSVPLVSYLKTAMPDATFAAGQLIYVSNEAGGSVPAFSDGTDWRRVTDRAIVS